MMKVYISSAEFPQAGLDILKTGFDEIIQSSFNGLRHFDAFEDFRQESKVLMKDVDAIIWCTKNRLSREYLEIAGKNLKVISTYSAGVDHIDVEEIKARNLVLCKLVGDYPVAEVALLLILSISRRVPECLEQIQSGVWANSPQQMLGYDMYGKTVGIIGFGNIGQLIAKRLQGFDLKEIVYSNPNPKPKAENYKARFVSFDELLEISDFVILSAPLTDTTQNMINAETLGKMKSSAFIVSISRGGLIDQEALIEALKNNKIRGAALDVMTPEPLPKDHPLISLPNCFLLPHIGTASVEARSEMAEITARNAVAGSRGEPILPMYQLLM